MNIIDWDISITKKNKKLFKDEEVREIEELDIPSYGNFEVWWDAIDRALRSDFYTDYVGAYCDIVEMFKAYSAIHSDWIVKLIWEEQDSCLLPQLLIFNGGKIHKWNARLVYDMDAGHEGDFQ